LSGEFFLRSRIFQGVIDNLGQRVIHAADDAFRGAEEEISCIRYGRYGGEGVAVSGSHPYAHGGFRERKASDANVVFVVVSGVHGLRISYRPERLRLFEKSLI
jgi:hypothetical protein